MIIEFKVANYRSIRDEQTLSFVASNYSDELPRNLIEAPIQGLKGAKLVKAAAIYGANASGKSNLLEALRFMVTFVRDSATGLRPDAPTGTHYFKLDPACASEPSKFELHAIVNGTRMLYGLEVTRERVTSEYLVAYPKGKPQVWFERDWKAETGRYDWSKSSVHFPHDAGLRSRTRENASFISMAAQFGGDQAESVWSWFGEAFHFSDGVQKAFSTETLLEVLKEDNIRRDLPQLLARADLGIGDVRIARKNALDQMDALPQMDAERAVLLRIRMLDQALRRKQTRSLRDLQTFADGLEIPSPEFLHRGKDGSLVPLDFEAEESQGTRRYLSLLMDLLFHGMKGAMMIVDEMEASLHPLLVRDFIERFAEMPRLPWFNGQFPQLLFTTHNPLLLDQSLLRRDQIWFTEKDHEGATRLYPLTDFKPRKEEALVKGYLSGRYGGIPFIPEHLTVTP